MITQTTVDNLRAKYEDARKRADARYPGSVVAGPANYPAARHEQAHSRVRSLYTEYTDAAERLDRSTKHHAHVDRMTEQTNAIAGDWIANLAVGVTVNCRWTNCGETYTGQIVISKINARTLLGHLVADVGGYGCYKQGHQLIFPKVGTPGNGVSPLD